MSQQYTLFPDLGVQLAEIAPDTIVSRTLYSGEDARVMLFGFAPGQELTEHTAARPAILQVIRGTARITLGTEEYTVNASAFVHMPAHLPHSVYAKTEVQMLLIMLGGRQ